MKQTSPQWYSCPNGQSGSVFDYHASIGPGYEKAIKQRQSCHKPHVSAIQLEKKLSSTGLHYNERQFSHTSQTFLSEEVSGACSSVFSKFRVDMHNIIQYHPGSIPTQCRRHWNPLSSSVQSCYGRQIPVPRRYRCHVGTPFVRWGRLAEHQREHQRGARAVLRDTDDRNATC